jgi:hypothetical protein
VVLGNARTLIASLRNNPKPERRDSADWVEALERLETVGSITVKADDVRRQSRKSHSVASLNRRRRRRSHRRRDHRDDDAPTGPTAPNAPNAIYREDLQNEQPPLFLDPFSLVAAAAAAVDTVHH